jgi:hypothetical protein
MRTADPEPFRAGYVRVVVAVPDHPTVSFSGPVS